MKKAILFTLAIASVATLASAQEFKQAAGSKTLEVQLAPLGGSPIGISGIQFRKFSTETSAIRAGLFLGFMSSSDVTQQKGPVIQPELLTKESSLEISLQPGFEKHMAGTDRLSPYWGAVLDIGFKSTTKKEEKETVLTATNMADSLKVQTVTTKGDGGFIRFGAGLVMGTDFYFAKKFYVGAEFGIGLGFTGMSTIKTEDTSSTVAIPDQNQGSELNFGPTVNSRLRLGWNF